MAIVLGAASGDKYSNRTGFGLHWLHDAGVASG